MSTLPTAPAAHKAAMIYSDIPQFPKAHWNAMFSWKYVSGQIQKWQSEFLAPLNLDPDYQRAHVWTPEQQTAYIEYALQGGEVGRNIIFNCPGWMGDWRGPFELLDGKQRLGAVRAFWRNEVPIFGGHCAKDIGGVFPWSDVMFNFQICRIDSRQEVLRLYLNINAGGTPHTQDELDRVRQLLAEAENQS